MIRGLKVSLQRNLRLLVQATLLGLILQGSTASRAYGEASTLVGLPEPLTFDSNQGKILLEITFGPQGEVAHSRVARSNAPYPLEISTIAYVRKYWRLPLFAGKTKLMPIVFDAGSTIKWDDDLPPPPNLFPVTDLKRELTLRLTFGPDGWASDSAVIKPSGDDSIDRLTAIWIKAHWHHEAYANKTIDAPFLFTYPAPAPPPKPKPAPPPPEPVAIPAIRAM